MAVLKEYRCSDCSRIFDSTIPSCIHCGSLSVTRIFVTPFSVKSDRTKFSDDQIRHQVESYGLSDFTNNQNTIHTPDTSDHWLKVDESFKGNVLPQVQGGSIKIEDMKGRAAGRYEVTGHKEDKAK